MSFRIILDGVERQVEILRRRPHLVLSVEGREHVVEHPGTAGDGLQDIVIASQPMSLARVQSHGGQILRTGNRTFNATLLAEGEEAGAGNASSEIRAPMPGAVVSIDAAPGHAVAMGDPIVTIESMKLQTVLVAPRDGIVTVILVCEGESFDKDQLIAQLAEEREEGEDA